MRPLAVHISPHGNAFMRDIAAWLVEAGSLLGRTARLHDDGRAPADREATNLVVAPHEFYTLGGFTDREIDDAARISTPVCTEQPGTTWFDITRVLCRSSRVVLDINAHGAEALRGAGLDAEHLRLGAVPSMDRRDPGGPRARELLFMGGRTPRRGQRLAELAPLLWDRAVDLRLFSFDRPVQPGVGGLAFGPDKYDLLADSRIVLNLHRDDGRPGYFEWARMIEAMANGCCVVTEPSSGHEPLEPEVHFLQTTVQPDGDDDLAQLVEQLLDEPERAAGIGARAAAAVLDEYPMTMTLGPALDRIESLPTSTRRHPFVPRYESRTRRAQQIPLLPAFAPNADLRQRVYRAMIAEIELRREVEQARCLLRHGVSDHVDVIESAAAESAPEVSVIVTLFDYAQRIVETLDSIASSLAVELEIVVVDDHSTDEGRDVVRRWIDRHPDVRAVLVGSDVNRGLPAARNLAFEYTRAENVMVMDADNLVYPTALRRLADALDADPGAAFAYSMLEEFGTSTGIRSAMAWHVPWLCAANYIDAQAMIRRTAWERHGGYRADAGLTGWEDWDLWLRIAVAGEHATHVPQMLGRYRTQQASMLSTTNLVADHMLARVRARYSSLPWPVD